MSLLGGGDASGSINNGEKVTKSEIETLLAENKMLKAEVKEKIEWWQEYVQHYGDLEEDMEQLQAENKELKRRLANWMSE